MKTLYSICWQVCLPMLLTLSVSLAEKPGTEETAQPPIRISLDLQDGSRIVAMPAMEKIRFKTVYAEMNLSLRLVGSIDWSKGSESATINFRNGDKLQGSFGEETLELTTLLGKHSIPVKLVTRVQNITGGASPANLPGVLEKELVLHFSFDKDKGADITDSSGRGNHGILNGAQLVEHARGANNVACKFDNDTSVDCRAGEDSAAACAELTLAAWVKPDRVEGIQQLLARTTGHTRYQDTGSFGLDLGLHGELVPGFHFNDGTDRRYSFGKSIEEGKWAHLAAVLTSEGTVACYIDGARVLQESGAGRIPELNGAYFRLGRWEDGTTYAFHFKGALDEVMLYRRALSENEVQQIYSLQK